MNDFLNFLPYIKRDLPWLMADLILLFFLVRNNRVLKGKFYWPILLSSMIINLAGILFQMYLHYSLAMNGTDFYRQLFPWSTLTLSAGFLLLLGVMSFFMEEKLILKYKQSVWGLLFLSLLTLGIYAAYWYLKRSIQFTRSGLAKAVIVSLAYFLMLAVFYKLYNEHIVFGDDQSIHIVVTFTIQVLLLASLWTSAFTIRNGIIKAGMYCDPLATFFLGPLYLQYKINQLAEQGEHSG